MSERAFTLTIKPLTVAPDGDKGWERMLRVVEASKSRRDLCNANWDEGSQELNILVTGAGMTALMALFAEAL